MAQGGHSSGIPEQSLGVRQPFVLAATALSDSNLKWSRRSGLNEDLLITKAIPASLRQPHPI